VDAGTLDEKTRIETRLDSGVGRSASRP